MKNYTTIVRPERSTRSIGSMVYGWLPVIYYWANLFRMSGRGNEPYIISSLVAGGVGLYLLVFSKKLKLRRNYLYTFLLVYSFTGLLNSIFIGNSSGSDIISNVFIFGITVLLYAYPINYLQGLVSFLISILFFGIAYLNNSWTHELLLSSGNYISVLLILAVSLYYIGVYNTRDNLKLVDVIPSVLVFLLSVWARGRGGILSSLSLLIMIYFVYYRQRQKENSLMFWILFISLIAGVFALMYYEINLVDEFFSLGKWNTRGVENERGMIWGAYFDKMSESILYVINGAPLEDITIISFFGGNTHSSFIQLHAFNGIVMLLVFFIVLIKSLIYFYKNEMFLLLVVTLTVVLRGFTDKFIFGQYGMPIILYFALYSLGLKKK